MSKAITAASLKDQIGTTYPRPFLYCYGERLNPDQPMKDLCGAILRDVEGN